MFLLKISVCGKGGSGKSTLVALLAREFLRRGSRVLVVDSDESNVGLAGMLGLGEPPAPLMDLAGGRKKVKMALGTDGTSILARSAIRPEDLPDGYVRARDSLKMIAIGKIHQALEGCACPIGALSREFLKKLVLDDGEVALVDMEAGVEHFGRGVDASVDAVVAVVEPSLESVKLAERVKELSSASGARFAGAVLNKITSEDLARRLGDNLASCGVVTLAAVRFHPDFVESALQGGPVQSQAASKEVEAAADAILSAMARTESPKRAG